MFDCLPQSATDNKRFIFIDIKLALWGKKILLPQICLSRHVQRRPRAIGRVGGRV